MGLFLLPHPFGLSLSKARPRTSPAQHSGDDGTASCGSDKARIPMRRGLQVTASKKPACGAPDSSPAAS